MVLNQFVVGIVTAFHPCDLFAVTLNNTDSLDTVAPLFKRLVDNRLEHVGFSFSKGTVSSNNQLRLRIDNTVTQRFSRESAKDYRVDGTNLRTGEHADGRFRDHRHVEYDTITLLDTKFVFEHIGGAVDFIVKFAVGQGLLITIITFKNDGSFVLACGKVSVDTLVCDIEFTVFKPFVKRRILFIEYLRKGFEPVELLFGVLRPEAFVVLFGLFYQVPVLIHTFYGSVFKQFFVRVIEFTHRCSFIWLCCNNSNIKR